jgi:hypothetical protein
MEQCSELQGGMGMIPNLTSAYMAGEIERSTFETRAARRRLIDEAIAANAGASLTSRLRHRIGVFLVTAGSRLDDSVAHEAREGMGIPAPSR